MTADLRRWIDESVNEWADRPNMTPPNAEDHTMIIITRSIANLDMTGSTDRPEPLTVAQRQATHRQRKAAQAAAWHTALEEIDAARTIGQARTLARAALYGHLK